MANCELVFRETKIKLGGNFIIVNVYNSNSRLGISALASKATSKQQHFTALPFLSLSLALYLSRKYSQH
jgi:hypothetical protein